jgi:hypothetical protein
MPKSLVSTHTPGVRPPPTKSMGRAFVLTSLFGPLGLLYATLEGALVMLAAGFALALFTLAYSILIVWPVSIIWACRAVRAHNRKMRFVYAG